MPFPDPHELDAWVALSGAGDTAAFRRWFDATYRELRLFTAARCPDQELVDEVIQATYVVAFEQLATYRPGGTFLSWLKGIARNRLMQELKRRKRHVPVDILQTVAAESGEPLDLKSVMERCLDRLAPMSRRLLNYRYAERISVQDIATKLGRTAGSVSVSLHRVRTALHACLEPQVRDGF